MKLIRRKIIVTRGSNKLNLALETAFLMWGATYQYHYLPRYYRPKVASQSHKAFKASFNNLKESLSFELRDKIMYKFRRL